MNLSIAKKLVTYFPSLSEELYDLPLWYWVLILFSLIFSILISGLLRQPLSRVLAFFAKQEDKHDRLLFMEKLEGPIHVFTTIIIFLTLSAVIGEPENFKGGLSFAVKMALFFSFTYLGYRLIDLTFTRLMRQYQSQRSRISLVLPLGRRIAKTFLIIIALLLLLSHLGVDVSSLLLGLGVGGLAIALAAQKILENLFGGAVLSLDQPFQVGDYCKCGDILGYIEEIGLRSTRIRTLDRTLVSIPNFKLSEMYIENYMEREKIRLYSIIKFDLSTPISKLQELLSQFEKILIENDNFYKDVYRIRLIGISEIGYEVEIYAFARSVEWSEFVRMREDLLFSFLEKIESSKVQFAKGFKFDLSLIEQRKPN